MSTTKGEDEGGFLTRWSRRKTTAQPRGIESEPKLPPAQAPATPAESATATDALPTAPPSAPEAPPALTMDDVARLTAESDYSRFVAGNVDPGVKNAAMKKLFSDPHYNLVDMLDVYMEDYGKPDPLPPGMLRQMAQSQMLGLFADEAKPEVVAEADTPMTDEPDAATSIAPPALESAPDEDPDLRLQPDDTPRREGVEPGAEQDAAGER